MNEQIGPVPGRPRRDDWLSLGPASRMIGVDPDTLRRWSDTGRVTAYLTPGGHRRFSRRSLERLVEARQQRGLSAGFGATPERLTRAYRTAYRRGMASDHGRPIGDAARAAFREDGLSLVTAIVDYIDAPDGAARSAAEAVATAITDRFAARLAAEGYPTTEAVRLFVAARQPLLDALESLGSRACADPVALSTTYPRAVALLDGLVLRLIAGLEARR